MNVARERELENVMSNSFAFGGTNASIIFSKKPHPAEQTGKRRICVTGIGELLSEADGTASVQRELTPEDFGARDVKLGFYRKLDRFSQMQVLSGVDALRDAGFTIDADNASRVGSTIGTADGPMAMRSRRSRRPSAKRARLRAAPSASRTPCITRRAATCPFLPV